PALRRRPRSRSPLMERRVLLAIVLSFLVLITFQQLVEKPARRPASAGGSSATRTEPSSAPLTGVAPATNPTAPPPAAPEIPASAALVGDANERELRIETRDIAAVLTNRGARLK